MQGREFYTTNIQKIDLFKISWGGILDIDIWFVDYYWKRFFKLLVTNPLLLNYAVYTSRDEFFTSRYCDVIIIEPLGDLDV